MEHYPFLTLSGASGSGKTVLMDELIERYPKIFGVFKSVTTRKRRPSDNEGAFIYLETEEFSQWEKESRFAWVLEYSGHHYGTTKKTLEEVLHGKRTAISPIVPNVVKTLRTLVGPAHVISIYIVSLPEELMRQRMQLRGDESLTIEKRIIESASWDTEARKSDIPFHFVENTGSVDDLVVKVLKLLKYN